MRAENQRRRCRRGCPPPKERRDKKVKKDIFAAITFLTAGFLFYLAQTVGEPQKVLSAETDSGVVETIVVEKIAPQAPEKLFVRDPQTRDS